MSDEIAVAFKAIKKTNGLRVTLTRMGTQVGLLALKTILDVVEAAYEVVTKVGSSRNIFTVCIDQRLDKIHQLENRVKVVKRKLDRHKLAST